MGLVNALRFEAQQEKQLIELQRELETRTYRPGRSVCFFATRPKLREIFAADFAVSLRLIAAFIAVVPVLILHT
jgi:hypothetical protein